MSRSRLIRNVLAGVAIAVQVVFVGRLVLAAAPGLWESRWVQDDAYISFRYARNLVEGNGLVFNVGDRVEGYTNFLWTVMAAVPLAAGADDPLPTMHRVARLLWFATFALLVVFGIFLAWRRNIYTAPLIAFPLLAHWSFNQWYLSGMETPLVTFLSLLTVVLFAVQEKEKRFLAATFGLSCALLLMSRPDTAVFLVGLALALAVCHPRWLRDGDFWRRWAPSFLASAAALYLPYTLWRLWYYGGLLPNTYYAKAAYNTSYQRGWEYLTTYFEVYHIAAFLLVPVAAAVLTRDGVVRRFLVGCVLGAAGVVFYVVRLGGDFMEWRFLVPVTGVLVAAIGVGLYVVGYGLVRSVLRLATRSRGPDKVWISVPAVAVGIVCALLGMARLDRVAEAGRLPALHTVVLGQETIPSLAKYAHPEYAWGEIGRTCRKTFPTGTRIATTAAGLIPYFAELPTLDLHGLTDREIARQPIPPEKERRMGHDHELGDRNVMRERGVDVYLRWPMLWDFPPALAMDEIEGEINASIRLPSGKYFDVVFLNPESELVREVHNHDWVIFKDLSRVLPKEDMVIHAPLLSDEHIVDFIDVEVPESEAAHGFKEIFDPEAPYGHNYHDKVLAYLGFGEPRVLRDEGRKIFHQAEWVVSGVSANEDLEIVVRHDHTVSSQYRVEVNGRPSPSDLVFPRLPEQWGETRLIIQRELLRDGENRFRITRDRSVIGEAEFFYMWFLQKGR